MDVNANKPIPAHGENSEQTLMGESHADDSDLVLRQSMHVEAPEEFIKLSCDASRDARG